MLPLVFSECTLEMLKNCTKFSNYLADFCGQFQGIPMTLVAFEEDVLWKPRVEEFNLCTGAQLLLYYIEGGEDGMEDALKADLGTYYKGPNGTEYEKTGAGVYDAYIVQAPWLPAVENDLENLGPMIGSTPQIGWSDISEIARQSLTWNNTVRALPLDSDYVALGYRADVFAKWGKSPPETLQELAELSEFFNGKDHNDDGIPDFGFCLTAQVNYYMAFVAPFLQMTTTTCEPNSKKCDDTETEQNIFFDAHTMTPLIYNQAFRAAVDLFYRVAKSSNCQEQLKVEKYAFKCHRQSAFKAGRCAGVLSMPGTMTSMLRPWDHGGSNSPRRTNVNGTVIWTPENVGGKHWGRRMRFPGSTHVWDRSVDALVPCNKNLCPKALPHSADPSVLVNYAGFFAEGGEAYAIRKTAAQLKKEVAFTLFTWIATLPQGDVPLSGVYRKSQLANVSLIAEGFFPSSERGPNYNGWADLMAQDLATLLGFYWQDPYIDGGNPVEDLLLLGFSEYMAQLATSLFKNFVLSDKIFYGNPTQAEYENAYQDFIKELGTGYDKVSAKYGVIEQVQRWRSTLNLAYLTDDQICKFFPENSTALGCKEAPVALFQKPPYYIIGLAIGFAALFLLALFVLHRVRQKYLRKNELIRAEMMKAQRDIVGIMSHELRTPINGIVGMLQLLQFSNIDREQAEMVENLYVASEELVDIVRNVLDFSKLESDVMDSSVAIMDVETMVCTAITSSFILGIHDHIDVSYKIDDDVPKMVMGDFNHHVRALSQIVQNALKFSLEYKGHVHIHVSNENLVPMKDASWQLRRRNKPKKERTEFAEQRLRFSVQDTGVGVNEEKKSNLFLAFSQADTSDKRAYGGLGLGLALCSALVRKELHGEVWLDWSEEGKGSRFCFTTTVEKVGKTSVEIVKGNEKRASTNMDSPSNSQRTLPARMGQSDPAANTYISMQVVRNARNPIAQFQRALVIDDCTGVIDNVVRTLKDMGVADVDCATSKFDGLQLVQQPNVKFDLIVIDLVIMPANEGSRITLDEVDGVTLAQEIRKIDPKVRMILLKHPNPKFSVDLTSSFAKIYQTMSVPEGLFAGVATKPVIAEQLRAVVEQVALFHDSRHPHEARHMPKPLVGNRPFARQTPVLQVCTTLTQQDGGDNEKNTPKGSPMPSLISSPFFNYMPQSKSFGQPGVVEGVKVGKEDSVNNSENGISKILEDNMALPNATATNEESASSQHKTSTSLSTPGKLSPTNLRQLSANEEPASPGIFPPTPFPQDGGFVDIGNERQRESLVEVRDDIVVQGMQSSEPLVSVVESKRPKKKKKEAKGNLAKAYPLSVLIVEDNRINMLIVIKFLKKLGYTEADITEATNGQEAVYRVKERMNTPQTESSAHRLYRDSPIAELQHLSKSGKNKAMFDLVLMDLQMPIMDGFDATRIIKKLTYSIKKPIIVALTANDTGNVRARCTEVGMTDFLTKPLSLQQLTNLIKTHATPADLDLTEKSQGPSRKSTPRLVDGSMALNDSSTPKESSRKTALGGSGTASKVQVEKQGSSSPKPVPRQRNSVHEAMSNGDSAQGKPASKGPNDAAVHVQKRGQGSRKSTPKSTPKQRNHTLSSNSNPGPLETYFSDEALDVGAMTYHGVPKPKQDA
eukprot:g22921.t1